MLLALLLTLVVWTHPAPTLWVCDPGHAPGNQLTPCQRLHYSLLGRFPAP